MVATIIYYIHVSLAAEFSLHSALDLQYSEIGKNILHISFKQINLQSTLKKCIQKPNKI